MQPLLQERTRRKITILGTDFLPTLKQVIDEVRRRGRRLVTFNQSEDQGQCRAWVRLPRPSGAGHQKGWCRAWRCARLHALACLSTSDRPLG